MQIQDTKRKIQLAIEIVKDVPEPFRMKAFEVVLKKILMESIKEELSSSSQKQASLTKDITTIERKIERLAKTANVNPADLADIFHFGEKEPTFIGKFSGNEAEKQFLICRLILLAMDMIYGQNWVKGSFLGKILKDCGVGSRQHLAENLGKYRAEFRTMGQKKGKKYKLTQVGKRNAIESLRQYITQQ